MLWSKKKKEKSESVITVYSINIVDKLEMC